MTGFRKRNSRTAGNRAALDRVWHGMREWTRILKANFGGGSGNEDFVPINEKETPRYPKRDAFSSNERKRCYSCIVSCDLSVEESKAVYEYIALHKEQY